MLAGRSHPVRWLVTLILLGLYLLIAQVSKAGEQRVDLFDTKSKRTGYAIIKKDRVDAFDTKSRRTGYGTITRSSRSK